MTFPELVRDELINARTMHVFNIMSYHEGYAVILEELDELKHEVFKKSHLRSNTVLLEELVHISAMAQRCAEDLGLVRTI